MSQSSRPLVIIWSCERRVIDHVLFILCSCLFIKRCVMYAIINHDLDDNR